MNGVNKPLLVCSVQIESMENHTWQGRVLAEGREASFHSERELLKVVEALLKRTDETGYPPGEARLSAAMKKEEQP